MGLLGDEYKLQDSEESEYPQFAEGELNVGQAMQQPPILNPKPGYKTSQGQITAVLGLVVSVLSFMGWNNAADQVNNWAELISQLVEILGPLMLYIPVLITYINSRGKVQSNTLWSNAAVLHQQQMMPAQLGGFGKKWDKIIKGVGQGIAVGGALGVPGLQQADAVIDMVGGNKGQSDRQFTDAEIKQAIEMLGSNDMLLNRRVENLERKVG